ncbi:LacI family DNA-binding transcriptional regulator [Agromyces sp. ZXT2-6]|uniref:LacI family DNA-binding transcriptional regulator n=1 Tax=Agromyces sp. ZXT2-6 TaxID=3461153 RepID=UPI004054C627
MPEPAGGFEKRSRPTTLRDVAELAGVSIATVSKSLNGREHVHPKTRERVLLAAEKLRFAPNSLAQGLLTGRTGTVGLLTSDMEGRFSLPILVGTEDAFGTDSTSAFLCDARGDAIREKHHIRALLGRRVDGLIVVGDKTDPRPSLGQTLPVPVVYAYAPSDDPSDISVISDNVQAGRIAAEHVISCGRRRIAYVAGDITYAAARDRVAGAVDALQAAGLELLGGEALYGAWTEEWGRGAMRTLLTRFPDLDAVLCGSDQIARGALDALRDLGRSVPYDVAVMAHDNWEPIATQARPPLSTIDMQLELLGRRAAELLFDAIGGNVQPGIHTVSAKLVTRGSTALA